MAKMSTQNPGPEELDVELIHIIVQVPKDTVTVSMDERTIKDEFVRRIMVGDTPETMKQRQTDGSVK